MCVTAAEGEELNTIAQDKNVVLSVYQNRRWDADFRTVKKLLASGKVGLARMAKGTWTDGSSVRLSTFTRITIDTDLSLLRTLRVRPGKNSRDSTMM